MMLARTPWFFNYSWRDALLGTCLAAVSWTASLPAAAGGGDDARAHHAPSAPCVSPRASGDAALTQYPAAMGRAGQVSAALLKFSDARVVAARDARGPQQVVLDRGSGGERIDVGGVDLAAEAADETALPDGQAGACASLPANVWQVLVQPGDRVSKGDRVVIRDLHDLVIDLGVEDFRNHACADTLNLVRAGLAAGEDGGLLGLDGHNLERRVEGFEVLAAPRESSAGTDSADENVNLTIGCCLFLFWF